MDSIVYHNLERIANSLEIITDELSAIRVGRSDKDPLVRDARSLKMTLRGYRAMLGLTQQAMADRLGMSKQSYHAKEAGKSAFTDKERLAIRGMVETIKPGITIDELFYDTERR